MVATITVAGVTTTSVLAASAVASATQVRLITVRGAGASEVTLHAGGLDVVALALANPHPTGSGPTQVRLTLPRAVSVSGVEAIDPSTRRPLAGRWHCATRDRRATCTLRGPTNGPAPSAAVAYVELVNHLGAAATPAPLIVRARLGGARASTLVAPVAVAPTNLPAISLNRAATPVLSADAEGSITYQVRDTGGAALHASPTAVTIAHALPVDVTWWSSTSPQWRCQGSPTTSPTCVDAAGIAVHHASAPLTLTYRVDAPALLRGRRSATDAWRTTLVVSGPFGARLRRPVPGAVRVTTGAEGSLRVQAATVGSQSVARGATRTLAIVAQASDGVASGLVDTIIVPRGLTMLAHTGGGWRCPGGTGTVTCRHPSPLTTNAPVTLDVALHAASDAPVGMTIVAVVAAARDGSAKNAALAIVNVLGPRDATPVAPSAASPTAPAAAATRVDRRASSLATTHTSTTTASSATTASRPATLTAHVVPAATHSVDAASAPTPPAPRSVTCPTTGTNGAFTLGPFSITASSLTAGSTACTGAVTISLASGLSLFSNLSLSGTVTYTDASDWALTVSTTQSGVSFFGATPIWTGVIDDNAGTTSGSLTLSFPSSSPATLGGLVTLSGDVALSVSAGALTTSAALTIGITNPASASPMSFPVTLSYTDASDWSVALTNATLPIGPVSPVDLSVSGTLSDTAGTLAGSLSATVPATSPVTVFPGVTLSGTISFAIASTSPTFTGSVTLNVGTLSLPVSFAYSDASDWSATIAASQSPAGFTVAPNFTIPLSSLSGSVTYGYTGGGDFPTLSWDVTATLAPVTLVNGVASLSNTTLSISTCPPPLSSYQGQPVASPCPATATGTFVFLDGTLNLTFPGLSAQSLTFAANVNLATGGFDLSATMPGPITVVANVLSVSAPTFQLSYDDPGFANPGTDLSLNGLGTDGGFQLLVSATASLSFAGTTLTIPVSLVYDTSGLAVVAQFTPAFSLGATGASINTLAFTTAAATLSLNGLSVSVPADTFVLGGSLSLPSFLQTYLGTNSSIAVDVTYSSASDFTVNATFPMSVPVSASSEFSFTFGDLVLSAGVTPSQGPFLSLSESGTLTISGAAAGGTAQTIDVTLALTYQSVGDQLLFSIAGSGWNNAFGYPGLDITTIGIQAGVSLTPPVPTPSFGFTASGVLPSSITNDLGIGTGAAVPLSFTMNISDVNPCLAVAIGSDAPGAPSVINIGSGVITASYATFVAAPDGCTVAGTTISPGFAIGFNGTFVGVAVTFNASLTINPFSFTGTASVSGFSVGPFTLQNAYVSVTIGSSFSLVFSGGIQIGGPSNQVSVSGTISSNGAFNLTGTANITLAGFTMSVNVNAVKYDFSFFGVTVSGVSVTASASVSLLGSTVSIEGSFGPAPGGGVQSTLMGSANFSPDGFNLGSVNFTLSLSPQQQLFSASASVDLGGLFTGQISGTLNHVDNTVGFNFSLATSFSLGPLVAISGTLDIGNCSGACTTTTALGASISGSVTWDGHTYSFSAVAVNPSWSFNFTATGSINAQSGVIDTGLVEYSASFRGNYYVAISSSSPYVSLSSGFDAEIQARGGSLQTSCSGDWNPATWHCSTYVAWGGWSNLISVGASVNTAGQFSATYLGHTYTVSL